MATCVIPNLPKRPNPPKRPTLSRKVIYNKAMTVCIAAACRHGDDPCIVLCSDTRIDYGEVGSTNMGIKFDVLGHGWCIQMAGGWGNVNHWKDHLKRRIQSPKRANIEQIGNCLRESADYFSKSVFCESMQSYQLLISGFSEKEVPTIMSASLNPTDDGKHSLMISINDSFGCIGSGATVAFSLLTARECHCKMPMEYVSYLVYEAKRHSEKTGSVGKVTLLSLQSPCVGNAIDQANLGFFSNTGMEQLEVFYNTFWKVPFINLPAFPGQYFQIHADLQDPQSTTTDPKPPQP
jgi:20S proteasome alpha/beta subunit